MNPERLEQLYREGKYQEAWWAYSALNAKGEADASVHLRGAQAARKLGHLYSALNAIEQALPLATGDTGGRVRNLYGILLQDLGRCEAAIPVYENWIANLDEYRSLESTHLGAVHYNLGLALRQVERYNDSVMHYQIACDLLHKHGQKDYYRMALQNLAWVACLCGKEGIASKALDQAEELCVTADGRWHQQIGKAFLLAVSKNGNLHGVMTLCQAIIEHPGDDVPMLVRSHAFWLAGRVALELDLGDTARYMAEKALWLGAAVGDQNRCLTDAVRLVHEIDSRLTPIA